MADQIPLSSLIALLGHGMAAGAKDWYAAGLGHIINGGPAVDPMANRRQLWNQPAPAASSLVAALAAQPASCADRFNALGGQP